MTLHVHFAIGPVQGFVAQARRTRDLWGGSYLLSFLSAHAMSGARKAGATIVQPLVDDDPLLGWIENPRAPTLPRYGSLPNQFTAKLDDDRALDRVIAAITSAFHEPWQQICDAVWRPHLAEIADLGCDSQAIWNRQTQGFWDLTWVAGAEEHGLLDRRKLWRTHRLPEEGGDKCTVMPELQELSGYLRSQDRDKQDRFWKALQGKLGPLELRDHERLCALALVKRLYAKAARQVIRGDIDVEKWPSTIDIAAVPWVQRALRIAPRQATAYASVVVEAAGSSVLTGGVSSLVGGQASDRKLRRLGTNWFHRGFAASPRLAPFEDPAREVERAALCDKLKELTRVADDHGDTLGSPPIYYALLLGDGDSLGKLLRAGGRSLASHALADFTRRVSAIVGAYRGCTIYAGGDDVLAILPIDHALDCAHALEQAFRRAFLTAADREASQAARDAAAHASLSVAVVFAHARSPLHRVLHAAHHLLDDIAKDQNGRSSLVAAIYRGAAITAQWVTTWQRARLPPGANLAPSPAPCDHGDACAVAHLTAAAHALASSDELLSSSLVYDLRHLLGLLCGDTSNVPGSFAQLAHDIDLAKLVRAEIRHRLAHQQREPAPHELDRLTQLVVDLLPRSHRVQREPRQVGIDGLVLASFLANGGREDDHTS